MVAKISLGNSLYGALAYNGEKINEEKGKLLATNKIFDEGTGKVDIHRAVEDFKCYMPLQVRTEKPVIHISLNPHPDDKLTDVELADIAREYMEKLGYGNQPFMVYKHEDIHRHHLHIVSIRVDENGKCLNNAYNFHRSKAITRELEKEYGLHTAERQRTTKEEPVTKVYPSEGNIKKQVGNVVKALMRYHFQSLGEYRTLLSLYNVTVEEVQGEIRGREYHGLVYSATDEKGDKVGNPLKSSILSKAVGYEALQKHIAFSKKQIRENKLAECTRAIVTTTLHQTATRMEFITTLKAKGIDAVFRETDTGRIYGATFIDHNSGCVFNGSHLGKELSANALSARFADFSTTSREALQPVTSTPAKETLRPSLQHETEDKQLPESRGYSGDDSPIGILLSVLTPEPDQHDNNEPMPKKRKKKKRRYGRQV